MSATGKWIIDWAVFGLLLILHVVFCEQGPVFAGPERFWRLGLAAVVGGACGGSLLWCLLGLVIINQPPFQQRPLMAFNFALVIGLLARIGANLIVELSNT